MSSEWRSIYLCFLLYMGSLGIIGRRKGGCRGGSKTLPFVRQNILEVFYVYTDAVKHGKVWDLGPLIETPSAGFSGTIQQTLVWRSTGLQDLFCCLC